MKRILIPLIVLLFSVPVALWAMQAEPAPRVEITGVNATELPTVIVTANVVDPLGQPIRGLGQDDFRLSGEIAPFAEIVSVENVSDDNLPFAVVLVIDVSSSMAGLPIQRAREAAQLFVESIGPNDPVAIYTFASGSQLVQDFTTDKAVLSAAIENLNFGGQTALYQGAFDAIGLAANAPTNRRAVVLLSDGAEFGNVSGVGREAALEEARIRGVSFYTIGLGYGIDRTYLQQLSDGTNARFAESPEPDQLAGIYNDLAALLRSQYIVTLNVDVPLNGQEYDMVLEVETANGTASAVSVLRAPIPVPIVTLPTFDAAISELTVITVDVAADDAIEAVTFALNGAEAAAITDEPYTFSIDPALLAPGTHQLEVSASDAQGDAGTADLAFEVAVLPPVVTVVSNLGGDPIENKETVILDVTGQTEPASAVYTIDGEQSITVIEVPFAFEVDPMVITPGDHTLTIDVTNAGGGTVTLEQPFSVANQGPYVVVAGLESGQIVDAPIEVEVDVVVSQSPVTGIEVDVNGVALESVVVPETGALFSKTTLDPMQFEPGNATFNVTATNETGGVGTAAVDFVVAALPPVTVIENLSDGETISEDRVVDISFISQTPVNHVAYFLDDVDLAHRFTEPWNLSLDVLALGPGTHELRIAPQSANGQQSAVTISFTVSDAPSLTATALVPTNTPLPTVDVGPTRTQQARATANAEGTLAANTQVAVDSTATERAFAVTGTAESRATGTEQANAAAEARGTDNAQSTQAAQVELNAQGTAFSQSTRQARSTQNANTSATRAAQATVTAEVLATVTAEQADVQATSSALAPTREAQEQGTETAEVRAIETREAQTTGTAEAQAQAATVTAEAQSGATETADAERSATQDARATQSAQVELNAAGTANAQATRTQRAVASETAESAQATAERNTQLETREAVSAATDVQATLDMEATVGTQLTAIATEEVTPPIVAQVATDEGTPRPSATPRGTLVAIEVDGQAAAASSPAVPILIVIAVVLILLAVLFMVLRGNGAGKSNE